MIIPIPALWSRPKPEDPQARIDRAIDNRAQRLMAGISVGPQFQAVEAALVVSVGHGKRLRLKNVAEVIVPIPPAIGELCRTLFLEPVQDFSRIAPLLSDLAEIQAAAVEQLQRLAGKYVDRVMAVAVVDPGLWSRDFDGRLAYHSLSDANRLAEVSGVTVIDALPARDIASGGHGQPLDALPLWMMLADRNGKIAVQHRAVLVSQGLNAQETSAYWLPPSDGLDAELPEIQSLPTAGFGFLNRIVKRLQQNSRASFDALYADGRLDETLYDRLNSVLENVASEIDNSKLKTARFVRGTNGEYEAKSDIIETELMNVANDFLLASSERASSLARTAVVAILDGFFKAATDTKIRAALPQEIFVAASPPLEACLINQLNQRFDSLSATNKTKTQPSVKSISQCGLTASSLSAVVAAMLGLMHIDQMPANVPWLTRADGQRILGRLTPGRPANWRQLLRTMADFQPAAMKLKDAV